MNYIVLHNIMSRLTSAHPCGKLQAAFLKFAASIQYIYTYIFIDGKVANIGFIQKAQKGTGQLNCK